MIQNLISKSEVKKIPPHVPGIVIDGLITAGIIGAEGGGLNAGDVEMACRSIKLAKRRLNLSNAVLWKLLSSGELRLVRSKSGRASLDDTDMERLLRGSEKPWTFERREVA